MVTQLLEMGQDIRLNNNMRCFEISDIITLLKMQMVK